MDQRKSNDAEVETLREEYHQRVATLERKVCLPFLVDVKRMGTIHVHGQNFVIVYLNLKFKTLY